MAWEFLRPILTPNALATIQANPILLAYFVAWLFVIIIIVLLALYTSYVTGKPYRKPKKTAAKKGLAATEKSAPILGGPKLEAPRGVPTGGTQGSRFNLNMKLPSINLPSVKVPSLGGLGRKGFFKL